MNNNINHILKITSWNVNSLRIREDMIRQFLADLKTAGQTAPDIFCMQEIKLQDHQLNSDFFMDLGYPHMHILGQKSYNGVGIFSKIPFVNTDKIFHCDQQDARHIAVQLDLPKKIELHNLYIPAGGDEPDRSVNPKFGHKLDFVDSLSSYFSDAKFSDHDHHSVLVGDFNIAPYEHDVWSHKQLLKVVSHTPIEVEKLHHFKSTQDWCDVARHFIPEHEKSYSWWSYRNRDWKKSNRGRRLDHIWASKHLQSGLLAYDTHPPARDYEKTSDHIPISVSIDLNKIG
jgi:exodeoxyribonuclease-3